MWEHNITTMSLLIKYDIENPRDAAKQREHSSATSKIEVVL